MGCDFKNFVDERVRMGPFTVIAGVNASGKSNIRDALRFLHGVGRGYTLAEILGGKYGPGGEVQWDGIRGAPAEVARLGAAGFAVVAEIEIKNAMASSESKELGVGARARYEIEPQALTEPSSSGQFWVSRESLHRRRGASKDIVYTRTYLKNGVA